MQIAFPDPVKLRTSVPVLDGLRHGEGFINIDGETFGKPRLNGRWRVSMDVFSHDMQSHLALTHFVTAMSPGHATCAVPIHLPYRPLGNDNRMLSACRTAPDHSVHHLGYKSEPYDGFILSAAAARRDGHIVVTRTNEGQVLPGMHITLGNRLHQVMDVSHPDETDRKKTRLDLLPYLRADYPAGEIVIVDYLTVLCRMVRGDQIGATLGPVQTSRLEFVEAF